MSHTVYVNKGTHYLVVAEYCGSPRHAALTDSEWASEYANDSAYLPMRTAHPGSVAGVTPQGVGQWQLDWSAPYVAPFEKIAVSSAASPEEDGVPSVAADGAAVHSLTLSKVNQDGGQVGSGLEELRVRPSTIIGVSDSRPSLVNGQATVTVGPSSDPGEVSVNVVDPAGNLRPGLITLRFS